jgi:hypothetical protein
MKPTTLLISTSIRQPFSWSGLFLIVLALVSFALLPTAQGVDPPPDGFYPIKNTAEGEDAPLATQPASAIRPLVSERSTITTGPTTRQSELMR